MAAGSLPPLETDDPQARLSDHRISFSKIGLPKRAPVKWLDYSYRYYNEDSARLFGGWLASKSWNDLRQEETSNGRAAVYQKEVVGAMEACFPLVKMRRKASDPPWINAAIRRKLRQRKGIYRCEG